ncbi:MAG: hypothetical protein A3J28_18380 [Acidobacteria bacterium RIFCSPLOWO2_12_FULL_60_22]|nr:MAG: hypothetical protein A3J28_18380 [Acidobacteria bacterium RIFCSPLOWO2_12_FULL_60_22]
MSYIAHLDWNIPNWESTQKRWCALAAEFGAPFRGYERPAAAGNVVSDAEFAQIIEFIRGAAGLTLTDDTFLGVPEFVEVIRELVAAGRPLFVMLSPNKVDDLNPFLATYGLEGTLLAVYDEESKSDERLIEISRKVSPGSFHPHPLLEGADTLLLQQPYAIRYSGITTPLLMLPKDRFVIVDKRTDYFFEWKPPDLSCFVLSAVGDSGGVLAMSCGVIHDPYVAGSGIFSGISARNNEALASNILKWLAGQPLHQPNVAVISFDLVDRIERSLIEFSVKILKGKLPDWWTKGIPLPIRQKCALRCEEEDNRFLKECYLDLIDIKTILEKNWSLFESHMAAIGWVGGKTKALRWLDDLNDIRKIVMHPVRRHFIPNSVDSSTVLRLNDLWDRIHRLVEPISKPSVR